MSKLIVATVVQGLGRKILSKSAGEDCYGAWLHQVRPRRDYIARQAYSNLMRCGCQGAVYRRAHCWQLQVLCCVSRNEVQLSFKSKWMLFIQHLYRCKQFESPSTSRLTRKPTPSIHPIKAEHESFCYDTYLTSYKHYLDTFQQKSTRLMTTVGDVKQPEKKSPVMKERNKKWTQCRFVFLQSPLKVIDREIPKHLLLQMTVFIMVIRLIGFDRNRRRTIE